MIWLTKVRSPGLAPPYFCTASDAFCSAVAKSLDVTDFPKASEAALSIRA